MKLGVIVYGLSEVGTTEFPHGSPDFLLKTPEEDAELNVLKDYLKSIAKTELSKLNLKSEDILWLSPRTKLLQKEVVPFPDASVIKMWIDENGAEIVLTESYINKFRSTDKVKFERLHQINRRTTARITSQEFDSKTAPSANPEWMEFKPLR